MSEAAKAKFEEAIKRYRSRAERYESDASTGEGWTEVVVTVDDPVAAPVKGTVEVQSSYFGYSADSRFLDKSMEWKPEYGRPGAVL